MYAYSNNGLSWRSWNAPMPLADGEVTFDHVPTSDELTSAFPGYAAAIAAQTLVASAAAALAAGFAVVSTGTPAISGTYPFSASWQNKITAVEVYVLKNGTFPGGVSEYGWLDTAGAPHVFPNVTVWGTWATAYADYVAALDQIIARGTGTLPTQPVTIA